MSTTPNKSSAGDAKALRYIDTDGKTPSGVPFTIRAYYDENSQCTSRALLWHPFNGVGGISVPMRAECWCGRLYYELTTTGEATEATARNCFLS